jgi:hydroxyacid-oxoacid transhydrogenase
MALETAFTTESARIKFGRGVTREVGYDMAALGAKRVMVVTDPQLAQLEPVAIVMESLNKADIDAVLYDQVRVEPTDASFKQAIAFAQDGNFDGFVAIGGGSSIDTAKVANLYSTYPADLQAYVNAPIGEGRAVPGAVKPLIAIPTTAGTGSETTGVAICDFLDLHVKSGISHRYLRPAMGILDPDNTRTMPPMVAACSGLDVLSHALESLTAIDFDKRPAVDQPQLRPTYQGANPISDMWSAKAIEMTSQHIARAIADPDDDEARSQMLLASAYAGIGFGNAGVHLPHAMSYPVSGMVRDYCPEGYPDNGALVPHGMSVILNAPAAFRFTAQANPERHLYGARLMGVDTRDVDPKDAGELVATALIDLMKRVNAPNGLGAIGFGEDDLDALVEGTLAQQRLTKLSPRTATADDFRAMFTDAMRYW